jgi:PAS domain S-box-containing protein
MLIADASETLNRGANSGAHDLLDEPEHAGLLRFTRLVERLFHVPAAYIALLGPDLQVVSHIGAENRYWTALQTFPLQPAVGRPQSWNQGSESPEGFVRGDLKFVASAPLRSIDGLELGILMIGDTRRRPDLSNDDRETLADLATILAGKMERRTLACQARETELSLLEAERRFRNIANSTPVLIIYSGTDGSCSFVNKTWLEFTGRTIEEEIGDGFEEAFHPDYRRTALETYWNAFQQRQPLTTEFPMRRHDGEYRWMLVRGIPRLQEDGAFAGYIGCFTDVTEQRAAALDLRKQMSCTAAVADASGASYLLLDRDGRIEQAGVRSSGRNPLGLLGSFVWESCDVIGPSATAIRDAFEYAVASETTAQASTPDHHWIFTPLRSEEGETVAVTATVFDQARDKSCGPACPNRE